MPLVFVRCTYQQQMGWVVLEQRMLLLPPVSERWNKGAELPEAELVAVVAGLDL